MTVPIRESKRRNNDAYNAKCDYISLRPQKAVGYAIRAAAKAPGRASRRMCSKPALSA